MKFRKNRKRSSYFIGARVAGFTIVEVVTAIGIASVGILTILATLSQGIGLVDKNSNRTIGVNIAERIYSDMQLSLRNDTVTPATSYNKISGSVLEYCYNASNGTSVQANPLSAFPAFDFIVYFEEDWSGTPASDELKVADASSSNIVYRARVTGTSARNGNADYSEVVIKVNNQNTTDDNLPANTPRNIDTYLFLLKDPRIK